MHAGLSDDDAETVGGQRPRKSARSSMSRVLVTGRAAISGRRPPPVWRPRASSHRDLAARSLAPAGELASTSASRRRSISPTPRTVEKLVTPGAFDVIVHAAAFVGAANTPDNLRMRRRDNVQAHANLVSAALKGAAAAFFSAPRSACTAAWGLAPAATRDGCAAVRHLWLEQTGRGTNSRSCRGPRPALYRHCHCGSPASMAWTGKDGALHAISAACAGTGRPITLKDPESRFRWLLIDDLLTAVDTLLTPRCRPAIMSAISLVPIRLRCGSLRSGSKISAVHPVRSTPKVRPRAMRS